MSDEFVVASPTPQRLDAWLAAAQGTSRAAAQARIGAGLVLVAGRAGRSATKVHDGDVVSLLPEPVRPVVVRDATAPTLSVVYEDEHLAVIDKPAGMVVHPAPGHPDGTLADALLARGDGWSRAGGEERAGIVHRLDRFTSGLMVVAKTDAAHRALAAELSSRRMRRTYWALVHGAIREDTGSIEAPIGRDQRHRLRMGVVDNGREAVTDFRVVERLSRHTVLDCSLRTGRTHQIRVHLAWIGRPIVDDATYGRDRTAQRPALHARRLEFTHPALGGSCVFEAPLPADLVALLEQSRQGPA